jgi:hypothetical protein
MTCAFARIGAVVSMRVEDYFANRKRWWVASTRKAASATPRLQKFKAEIARLNADCENKGGYTAEAATYYDRYSGDHSIDKAKQLRNEALQ